MPKVPRVEQIMNKSMEQINRMTEKELRANVQILASAANKRLARLGSTGVGKISPAYISAEKRAYTGAYGGKFGTKGKTRNQLLNEYKAVTQFLGMKTSSAAGWSKYRKKTYARMGVKPFTDPEREKSFWQVYRRIAKTQAFQSSGYGSGALQSDLHKVMSGQKTENLIEEINSYTLQNFSKSVKDGDTGENIPTGEIPGGGYYVVDTDGTGWNIDPNDTEDLTKLMEIKVNVEYEKSRSKGTTADGDFYELP